MPFRTLLLGVLALVSALGAVAFARWLSAPLGRGTLDAPAAFASLTPPKLAPRTTATAAPTVALPTAPLALAVVPAAASGAPRTWKSTLIVGLDKRPDAHGAGLADSLVVAVFDEKSGHAGLVSVPRDLWVTIPDYGDDRINVIPTAARKTKKEPLELFERVIADTLGFPVEHTVVVDLGVFERTVDAAGGVEVEVTCPIVDSFHDERVPGGRRKLDLPAGRTTLDGPTAAMYVRSRHGRSDFGRSRRQQAVLLGLRDKVLESDGWTLVPSLFDQVESSIVTNMKRIELLELARRALELDRSKLHGLVLAPPLTTAHQTEDGKAVLLPERAAIDAALARLFSAAAPGAPPVATPCPPADVALRSR